VHIENIWKGARKRLFVKNLSELCLNLRVFRKVFKGGAPYDTLGAHSMSKVKFGVSLDRELLKKIDAVVEASRDLATCRSEVIEAILSAFLKTNIDPKEKARIILIKHRKALI
jgi:hypothetical protein